MSLNILYLGHMGASHIFFYLWGAFQDVISLLIHYVDMFTNHSRFQFFSAQQYVAVGCIEDKHQRHYREVVMSRWFCVPLSHRHLFIHSLVVSMIAFAKKYGFALLIHITGIAWIPRILRVKWLRSWGCVVWYKSCLLDGCSATTVPSKQNARSCFIPTVFYIHCREACVTSNISHYYKTELNLPVFEIYLIHVHALLTWGEGIMLYFW